jgi:hypothetical protein
MISDAGDEDRDDQQPFGGGQRTEVPVDVGGDGEQLRAEGQAIAGQSVTSREGWACVGSRVAPLAQGERAGRLQR